MNDELLALADFDHRCSDEECVNFGQRTFSNNCKCHKTREQMMLEEIRSLRTLAAQSPEPVAWRWRFEDQSAWTVSKNRPLYADDRDVICEPLYTAPPQSAPVAERKCDCGPVCIGDLPGCRAASEATKSDGGVEGHADPNSGRSSRASHLSRELEEAGIKPGPSDPIEQHLKERNRKDTLVRAGIFDQSSRCGSYRCAEYGCFGYCEETPGPSDTRPADVTVYEPRCDCGHLFEICDAPNCNSALLDTYKIGAR